MKTYSVVLDRDRGSCACVGWVEVDKNNLDDRYGYKVVLLINVDVFVLILCYGGLT